MRLVPSSLAPFVKDQAQKFAGFIQEPWFSFLQQFSQPPSPVLAIVVGTSPFAYQAKEPGFLFVSGGTVSSVTFTRGSVTVTLSTGAMLPVQIGDIVTITYSVLPTVRFFPNYANPRS